MTFDFLKPGGPAEAAGDALPAVTICVSFTFQATNCQPGSDDMSADEIDTGGSPPAYIVGSPAALADWEGTEWTADLEQVAW